MVTLRLVTDDDLPGPSAEPRPYECVACFVDRMTRAHGCSDRLTWVALWRDRCAPRATALERRLRAKGGYCDCETLMNVFVRRGLWRDPWHDDDDVECAEEYEEIDDDEPPMCVGVRRGSTRACLLWI